MRLFVHGIGVLGIGFDEPFTQGLGRLEKIPIEDCAPLALRRRFSRLSKLAYVAASRAVADAGVDSPESLAIVNATALGEASVSLELMAQIHSSRGKTVSPKLVPSSVHSAPAGCLSIGWGNRRPSITVSQGWLSAEAGLAAACDIVEAASADRVLVVSGDEVDTSWPERLDQRGAGDWARALEKEAFQECAVALVLGVEPGGRNLGSVAAGVERTRPDAQGLIEMLQRNDVRPGSGAELRVRASAGGTDLKVVAASALNRDVNDIFLDGTGPGTSQSGALAEVVRFLDESDNDELLLLGSEVDELAFAHIIRRPPDN